MNRRRHKRGRGIGTHATGVGALVLVHQAFVVLTRGQRQDVLAVTQDDEAGFFASQKFFDHHAGASGAQLAVTQHVIDSLMGFVSGHGNHNALAGGQAIGLDDDRSAFCIDILMSGPRTGEGLVFGRRDVMANHERLGEILGALKLRRRLGGPEDAQATGAKHVHHALSQRRLRTDNGQVNAFISGKVRQFVWIRQRNVGGALHLRGAAVARRNKDMGDTGGLQQPPGQCVFAAARANDHQFHV